jgi:hypothetical protein
MLPTAKEKVVCCCIKPDKNRLFGPDLAQPRLLVGDPIDKRHKPRQKVPAAKQWASDKNAVPLFRKRGPEDWEYLGDFRVARSSEDPDVIRQASEEGQDQDVEIVLWLERVRESR